MPELVTVPDISPADFQDFDAILRVTTTNIFSQVFGTETQWPIHAIIELRGMLLSLTGSSFKHGDGMLAKILRAVSGPPPDAKAAAGPMRAFEKEHFFVCPRGRKFIQVKE